ncbi:hypothetical protein CVT24_006854 [Panaeolus cyanescens]|uniref:G domain-containing protein n=1 Tax=Panaeolus cyanescens TaxID=181874 RepID=A0A409WC16_9AGAR|nr:hypothetical protein CVT24_006854 [Panaeolus cyanescens]
MALKSEISQPNLHDYHNQALSKSRQIEAEACSSIDLDSNPFLILLMGSTGTGKSRFIGVLSGNDMGISKDQLEPYTQDVIAYKISNLTHFGAPIYLVDTPGFSDPKLSEMRIVTKLHSWMSINSVDYFHHLFYFHRITDPRLSGSNARTMEIFRSLTGNGTSETVTVVTTMWDTLWRPEQVRRAEARFNELQKEYFKDWVEEGSKFAKFMNTQQSVLSILAEHLKGSKPLDFNFERSQGAFPCHSLYADALQRNLLERISSLQKRLKSTTDDLQTALEDDESMDLQNILKRQKRVIIEDIQTTLQDMDDYGHGLDIDTYRADPEQIFSHLNTKYYPEIQEHLLAEATTYLLLLKVDDTADEQSKGVIWSRYCERMRFLHIYNPTSYPSLHM